MEVNVIEVLVTVIKKFVSDFWNTLNLSTVMSHVPRRI